MNEERGNAPVCPERLAAKIAAIKNFELPPLGAEIEAQPRLLELLWFLQWASQPDNYAGGLKKLAADLVAESGELIGTATMQKVGAGREYTVEEELRIEQEFDKGGWTPLEVLFENTRRRDEAKLAGARYVKKGREHFFRECIEDLGGCLADYLFSVCEVPRCRFSVTPNRLSYSESREWKNAPACFVSVSQALLAFMDRRKARVAKNIAETEITREISKWLEIARAAKRTVIIDGSTRFGKTEAVRNWCLQNPGLARLVQTPASNAEGDLLREISKTLGVRGGPRERSFRIREVLDHVLQHSGLMLVFDEAQFLIPGNYSKTTAPARLNWVRRSVMDKQIAAVLVTTPQGYRPAKERFVKKTGFAIAQFDERILKTVTLPDELCRADLLAIARIHFPALAQPYLEYVVESTVATERNYVSDIEKIAALARVNAAQARRKLPIMADIKNAIADVLPSRQSPSAAPAETVQPTPRKRLAKPVQRDFKPAAAPMPPASRQFNFSGESRIETPIEMPG